MLHSGELLQVKRGLFVEAGDTEWSAKSLAGMIYGPSYISFEYALAHYGLIPERADTVTSAIYNKNKNKIFHTPAGEFYYYYIPAAVYPYGVRTGSENNQSFLIAGKEKALCDTLYKTRNITSKRALKDLLFEDYRMQPEEILKMDVDALIFLSQLYRKNIFRIFTDWLKGEI
jgi:predicted transcriptional regulator of viral defense system